MLSVTSVHMLCSRDTLPAPHMQTVPASSRPHILGAGQLRGKGDPVNPPLVPGTQTTPPASVSVLLLVTWALALSPGRSVYTAKMFKGATALLPTSLSSSSCFPFFLTFLLLYSRVKGPPVLFLWITGK